MSAVLSTVVHGSPLGTLTLVAGPRGIAALSFSGTEEERAPERDRPAVLAQAELQLAEYFDGSRREFELVLDLDGTPLQRRVWEALARIPFGSTISYTELAHRVGRPDAVRAVAAAVGRTPVPILIPCHRVVAANGSLTGYRGGLARKAALLEHERRVATSSR